MPTSRLPTLPTGLPLALALLPLCGCTGDEGGAFDPSLLHTVRRGDLEITIRERGEISAAQDTKVVSELEGRATLIYLIDEGAVVEEGMLVAELDASEIDEKRKREEAAVARAESALAQAEKNVEIVEKELRAAESTAESQLEIARLRQKKLLGAERIVGAARVAGTDRDGTNGQIVDELRALIADALEVFEPSPAATDDPGGAALARAARAQRPTTTNLVEKVLALFEDEAALELQMGELGNQILQQISKINLSRADLEIAAETLRYSEQLAAEGFLTRSELSRHRIDYQRRIADMSLAWSDLDLLVNYTLPEQKITANQEVDNAALALESTRASGEARRVREDAELETARQELAVARERLETYVDQIAKAKLYAPSPGLVVYGRFDWDEPVYEGMEIRERQEVVILPDVSTMVAEVLVAEAQIDEVAPGQRATVVVDAFPGREFPAKVVSVSSLPDIRGSWRRDIKVYAVQVEIEGGNPDGELRPGMNSTITVDVGTVEDVPLIPQPALERQGERQYVWLWTPDGPKAREVQIGRNNLTQVEIVSGLDEGDRIHLVPPPGSELPDDTDEPDSSGDGDGSTKDPAGGAEGDIATGSVVR